MRILLLVVLVSLCSVNAFAQQPDTTATRAPQPMDTTATIAPKPTATTTTTAPPPTATTTTTAPPPPPPSQPGVSKVYYGGTLGFSFGDYFRFSIVPFVGYKLTPKLHIGGKVGYEYIEDNRYAETLTSHNYGGSVFSRVFPRPNIYGHAEFAYMSYKYKISNTESDRFWVPFLYLGGGLIKSMGKNASVFVEVLFDVLQDDKSPYEDWAPFISVGVGVGF